MVSRVYIVYVVYVGIDKGERTVEGDFTLLDHVTVRNIVPGYLLFPSLYNTDLLND